MEWTGDTTADEHAEDVAEEDEDDEAEDTGGGRDTVKMNGAEESMVDTDTLMQCVIIV